MESLELHYRTLVQAYRSLHEVISFAYLEQLSQFGESIDKKQLLLEMYRDSLIQRFEFSYELTWKFYKKYLFEKFEVNENSPRGVFAACHRRSLVDSDEVALLLEMIDARNVSSHVYNAEDAEEITCSLNEYYSLMIVVAKRIQNDLTFVHVYDIANMELY